MTFYASESHPQPPDRSSVREYPADSAASRTPWYALSRSELRAAAVIVVALAAIGLLLGFIWYEVAPRLDFTVVRQSGHLVGLQNDPESEAKVAADSLFAIITGAFGIASAAALWTRRGLRGPVLLLVLALASLLGAVIAWRFGLWLGRHPTHAEAARLLQTPGATLHKPLDLQAKGTLFFQPLTAVLVWLICLAFTTRGDLNHRH